MGKVAPRAQVSAGLTAAVMLFLLCVPSEGLAAASRSATVPSGLSSSLVALGQTCKKISTLAGMTDCEGSVKQTWVGYTPRNSSGKTLVQRAAAICLSFHPSLPKNLSLYDSAILPGQPTDAAVALKCSWGKPHTIGEAYEITVATPIGSSFPDSQCDSIGIPSTDTCINYGSGYAYVEPFNPYMHTSTHQAMQAQGYVEMVRDVASQADAARYKTADSRLSYALAQALGINAF